jgi:adenine-specific DNA-methyltransferase
VNPKSPNLGVRALPNLETKFVAANTLIGIEKPAQMLLRNPEIDKKEAELRKVREKHFTARTLKSKAKCREDDKRLRGEIAELLKNDGWDNTTAKQLAAWDPYDQNAHADFFDPEWMFGVREGFDVVIGNPPYVLLQNTKATSSDISALASRYATAKYKVDLYHLFIEVGINLLSPGGALTYITPNTFLKNKHCAALRKILVTRCQIHTVVLFYRPVFEDTSVDNLVFVCQLAASNIEIETNQITVHTVREGSFSEQVQGGSLIDQASILEPDYAFELDTSKEVAGVLRRIEANATPFGDIGGSYFGIQTHDRKAFVSESKQGDSWLPVIDGGNVLRYYVKPSTEYVNFQPENVKSGGDPAIYARQRIVVRQIGRYPEGTICPSGVLTLNTIYNLYVTDPDVDIKYLLGLINSRVLQFYWLKRFFDNKATFPKIKKQPLHSLPVIRCSQGEQTSIAKLVSRILTAKSADPAADTSALEREIDERVYKLYGLTAEEIAIVEGASASAKATADKSREAAQGKGGGK